MRRSGSGSGAGAARRGGGACPPALRGSRLLSRPVGLGFTPSFSGFSAGFGALLFVAPPLGLGLHRLLFELLRRGMNRLEQIGARTQPHHLMIEIPHRGFGMMQMPFER